jgi:predicted nucleic acid-binding protein
VSGFVLDASVTMAWCFEAQSDDYCKSILVALDGERAMVPEIWILEILNSLTIAERRRRLPAEQSDQFLRTLWRLPIDVESAAARAPWSSEVVALARATGLSSYDAAYLEVAKRKSLPLATRDGALRRAAARSGVSLFLNGSQN